MSISIKKISTCIVHMYCTKKIKGETFGGGKRKRI